MHTNQQQKTKQDPMQDEPKLAGSKAEEQQMRNSTGNRNNNKTQKT